MDICPPAVFAVFLKNGKTWTLAVRFQAFTGIFGKNAVFSWNTHRAGGFLCKWAKKDGSGEVGMQAAGVCGVWMVLKGKRILRLFYARSE